MQIVTIVCFGLLPFVEGISIWLLMIVSGIFMDGFMAISVTMLLETDGIKLIYSGTALGILFTIAQVGGVISPPLGNSFASVHPGLPFIFWAALCLVALFTLAPIKEKGWKSK